MPYASRKVCYNHTTAKRFAFRNKLCYNGFCYLSSIITYFYIYEV